MSLDCCFLPTIAAGSKGGRPVNVGGTVPLTAWPAGSSSKAPSYPLCSGATGPARSPRRDVYPLPTARRHWWGGRHMGYPFGPVPGEGRPGMRLSASILAFQIPVSGSSSHSRARPFSATVSSTAKPAWARSVTGVPSWLSKSSVTVCLAGLSSPDTWLLAAIRANGSRCLPPPWPPGCGGIRWTANRGRPSS